VAASRRAPEPRSGERVGRFGGALPLSARHRRRARGAHQHRASRRPIPR